MRCWRFGTPSDREIPLTHAFEIPIDPGSVLKGFNRFIGILLLATIGFSSGLHVVVFQMYGWARMYVEYSGYMSSEEALELALSGKELCGVCEAADKVRNQMEHNFSDFISASLSVVLMPGTGQRSLMVPESGVLSSPAVDDVQLAGSRSPPELRPPIVLTC